MIALGKLGSAEAVAPLIVALYQELPGVTFYLEARQALIEVGPAAIPALLETLERKNKAVEAVRLTDGQPIAEGAIEGKAAFALGILRAKAAEEKLASSMVNFYTKFKRRESVFASIPGAVSEIAYALGYIGGAKAQSAVERIVTDATEPRIAGAESLVEMGAKSSVRTLSKIAASGAGDLKSVIDAVAMLGSESDGKVLTALAAKEGLKTSAEAGLKALTAAGECKEDVACWRGKLSDADVNVRRRATRELGWVADQESLAELLKAAEDEDPRVHESPLTARWFVSKGLMLKSSSPFTKLGQRSRNIETRIRTLPVPSRLSKTPQRLKHQSLLARSVGTLGADLRDFFSPGCHACDAPLTHRYKPQLCYYCTLSLIDLWYPQQCSTCNELPLSDSCRCQNDPPPTKHSLLEPSMTALQRGSCAMPKTDISQRFFERWLSSCSRTSV